jgi:hypothetical protein
LVLAVLLLGALAFLVLRKKPQSLEISNLPIVLALLATPFAWVGYAVLLLPIILRSALATGSSGICRPVMYPLIFRFSN